MPKVGMRIIKSSIAVGICLVLSLLRPDGIVFYSCIAAVLCIQQDANNSKKVAVNRIKGTLLGGCFGLLVLMIEKSVLPYGMLLPRYLLISIMIIPIIYSSVLLKMTSASYISCVVFMSVTISHGMDVNPFIFTINRMIDTLIGIFVALMMNVGTLHYKNKQIVFVTTLDALSLPCGKMSSYTSVKLKQLLEQGANITLATHRSPATLLPMIEHIPFKLPLIVLHGAAQYDIAKQEYIECHYMQAEIVKEVQTVCRTFQCNTFAYTIKYHMLHVYYEDLMHDAERAYYHSNRRTPYKNMICHPLTQYDHVVLLHLIQPKRVIEQIARELKSKDYALTMVRKQNNDFPGYVELDIYDATVNTGIAATQLKNRYAFTQLYAFGSREEDIASFIIDDKDSVINHTVASIPFDGEVLINHKKDGTIRQIQKLFHQRT